MFIRNLERLAVGHYPVDFVAEVNRNVRQAILTRNRLKRHATHDTKPVMGPNLRTAGLNRSPTARTENEGYLVEIGLGKSFPCDPVSKPSEPAFTPSAEELNLDKHTCSAVSIQRIPATLFCVDTSRETFCSFLDLLKNICPMQNTVDCVTTDECTAKQPTETKARRSKRAHVRKNAAGGTCPESSLSGGSPSSLDTQTEVSVEQSRGEQGKAFTRSYSVGATPEFIRTEVLRCTLRLLTVNLFHLVRATVVRRVYRANYSDSQGVTMPSSSKATDAPGARALPTERLFGEARVEGRADVVERVYTNNQPGRNGELCSLDPNDEEKIGGMGAVITVPGIQGLDMETGGTQESPPDDMRVVLQELLDTLRCIIEGDVSKNCQQMNHRSTQVSGPFKATDVAVDVYDGAV